MGSLLAVDSNVDHRRSTDGQRWINITTVARLTDLASQLRANTTEPHQEPALAIVLASPRIDHEQLLEVVDHALPSVPTIGCTTAGMLASSRAVDAAAQVIVLGGPGFGASIASSSYEPHGCRVAGQQLGATISQQPLAGDHSAFLMLCDGIEGNVAEVIRGAYSVGGANTSIVGGCAGDDLAMNRTTQFADRSRISGGAVGSFLTSNAPIGIGVSHGWRRIGEPMIVTASDRTSVLTLDDRPASEAYLELVKGGETIRDSAEFARFAQTRPLGIQAQTEQVRFVTGSDLDNKTLEFLVPVPEGQMVWVMEGNAESVIAATRTATESAIGQLGATPPLGVIGFDCVARRGVLGNSRIDEEIDALTGALPSDTPIGGFYSYGEIARTGGALGLHHQTMVLLALA